MIRKKQHNLTSSQTGYLAALRRTSVRRRKTPSNVCVLCPPPSFLRLESWKGKERPLKDPKQQKLGNHSSDQATHATGSRGPFRPRPPTRPGHQSCGGGSWPAGGRWVKPGQEVTRPGFWVKTYDWRREEFFKQSAEELKI